MERAYPRPVRLQVRQCPRLPSRAQRQTAILTRVKTASPPQPLQVLRARARPALAFVAAIVAIAALWRLLSAPAIPPAAPPTGVTVPEREPTIALPHVPVVGAREQELGALREGQIVGRALELMRHRYVDPARMQPREMLEEALQSVAHLVPEMLVDTPQLFPDGQPKTLRVRIGEATWNLDATDVADPLRLGWTLLQALRIVADHLPPDVQPPRVEYVAVNGMLGTLDPYSHMLDPDQWRDMQTNTGGHFGGLGIVILTQEGVLVVQSVLPDSPAQKAGILPADEILQIDGEDTLNMSVDDAVDRLRGEVGTAARLMLRRKGWMQPQEVTVTRAVIHLQSVESRLLDNGVGYARIKNFQRGTADELREAVDTLLESGSQPALVLDLRDNPGGLLDEAVKVCDLFLLSGPAVITVTGGQHARDERLVSGRGKFRHLSLAVLVNGHSASASEVVAGSLKFSNRAIVVGEQSFGKASVQVPYEMGGAALKLTVAKYLVKGDVDLHTVGITPDVGVQFISATRENVSLFGPARQVRSNRRSRLAQPVTVPQATHRLRVLLPDPAQIEAGQETQAEVVERAPRQRAAQILRRSGDVNAQVTLKTAEADLAEMAREDDEVLVAHLKKQNIDWRQGEHATDPALRLEIADANQGIQVAAGDVLRVSVTLTNLGKTPLTRLQVLTRSDDPVLDGHEQLVGRLEPGQQRTVPLSVRVSVRHGNVAVPMRVMAAQDGQLLPIQDDTLVTVTERPQPDFAFRVVLDDAQAAVPDGILQPKEAATLAIEVQNLGLGLSQATEVRLRVLGAQRLHLAEGRVRLGQLAAGTSAIARFVVTGADPKSPTPIDDWQPVQLELTIADETLAVQRVEPIDVPWGRKPLVRAPHVAADRVHQLITTQNQDWVLSPTITLLEARLPPVKDRCELTVAGLAHFDAHSPARRFVTASVGGVKQAYQAGYSQTDVPFRAQLRLDSGLNAVTIQARAGAHRIAERQLLVHCTRASAAPDSSP